MRGLAMMLAGACIGRGAPGEVAVPLDFELDPDEVGMRIGLTQASGRSSPDASPVVRTVPGAPLPPAELAALWSTMPALAAAEGDQTTFALRPGSAPPPRTGAQVGLPWPPPTAPEAPSVPAGPLTVLRVAPEGEVPIAPHVSLTFSQPMVAVTSYEVAERTVPVQIEPAVPGAWRWLGTRTVVFDGRPRLPMATEFSVTVPAGTSSATGSVLADAVSFTFTTPAPRVTRWWPPASEPVALEPVIVLVFDQAIDRAWMTRHLQVRDARRQLVPMRGASEAELLENEGARGVAERAVAGRWVAVRPIDALEPDTTFEIVIPQGAMGTEGPRTSPTAMGHSFQTFPPLAVRDVHCGRRRSGEPCEPDSAVAITLTNPLDGDAFDAATVGISPEVPGMVVTLGHRHVQLEGELAARTAYTITLPAGLQDRFGQALGEPVTVPIETGPRQPRLSLPGHGTVVLDPHTGPTLPVHVVNHETLKVEVRRVTPADWAAWQEWQRSHRYSDATPKPLPGTLAWKGALATGAPADVSHEVAIDLSPWLTNGHGQLVVSVRAEPEPAERSRRGPHTRWVQVTQLGLTAFSDPRTVVGWATELADGSPAPDVELSIVDEASATGVGTTGSDGLAQARLPEHAGEHQILVATRESDVALLPASAGYWGGARWQRIDELDHLRWYVTDDRGLYRPGETVRVFGWLRRQEPGPAGGLALLDAAPATLSWTLTGPRGNELATGTAPVSPLGGFQVSVALPPEVNTGSAQLLLSAAVPGAEGTQIGHVIRIAEFRRPEFEVTTTPPSEPVVLGQRPTFDLRAAYFSGGALPGAPVRWRVVHRPASYRPPGNEGFTFGTWTPWWRTTPTPAASAGSSTLQGTTDPHGEHRLEVHVQAMAPGAMQLQVQGTVEDVNRQAWTSRTNAMVHAASHYVGVRLAARFVDPGTPVLVQVRVADLDGTVVTEAPVAVRWARVVRHQRNGRPIEEELDPVSCSVRTDRAGDGDCTFTPSVGGLYRISAVVTDPQGRPNLTTTQMWVAGAPSEPSRRVELERLTLVPEAQSLQPGDTARILVQTPFLPAEGVMTVQRAGLLHTERFTMEATTTVLEVPIEAAHIPDLTVQVDLVGAAERVGADGTPATGSPPRVAHASGSITFQVPPLERALSLVVAPEQPVLAPGSPTRIQVRVVNADGDPVPDAELAVVVVDEAVLSLTSFELPDPLDVFYAARGGGVALRRLRNLVALGDASDADGPVHRRMRGGPGGNPSIAGGAPMMLGVASEAAGDVDEPTIQVRSDFGATALFRPGVVTDPDGHASVDLTMPDSLTRYRVMVVAVAGGTHFGSSDAAITARKSLMVRPSAPRFLNFGDQVAFPVVVQNQTDRPLDVAVGVRATNLQFIERIGPTLPEPPDTPLSETGRRIRVPARDRVEVQLPAAAMMAGTARVQVVATSHGTGDATVLSLPVWTPATTEAFATTGSLESGALEQPIEAPADVWAHHGGLEITTSSTQLQALTDAVLYLSSYPYECNEQRASRVLGIAALRDVLSAFEADGLPSAEALEASVATDLQALAERQNPDGGFAFWRRRDPSWPYLSIHVAHAFARARAKGFDVPAAAWQRSVSHLVDIERHIPSAYSPEARRALRAYAIAVLRHMGEPRAAEAAALLREVPFRAWSLEPLGHLIPTLHDAGRAKDVRGILRHLGNSVAESSAGAHFVTEVTDEGRHLLLRSRRRTDGVLLEALLSVQPDSDLVEKVVRDLLAHRVKGRWGNTQENAFVLLALDRYFAVREREPPDFVARMWLGDGFLGEHAFEGRTTERAHVRVPMASLAESAHPQPLLLVRQGHAGRMYYRIGLSYAPRDLQLTASDHGFVVQRAYESLGDPADVTRDPDGTWRIRAGAAVRVRVTMGTQLRRAHVALVDPMPAGLEAMNPELATTGAVDPEQEAAGPFWWWRRPWFEHDNLRDDRAEAFTSQLWPGVYEYTYVARATTPGRFVVPPPRAEEMYAPETFGRGATATVVVEP